LLSDAESSAVNTDSDIAPTLFLATDSSKRQSVLPQPSGVRFDSALQREELSNSVGGMPSLLMSEEELEAALDDAHVG
jgi:hypothetical protein